MRKPSVKFMDIAAEIARLASMREQLVLSAFDALEFRHPSLAQTLLEGMGSRQRAAHWMCTHQRAFDGRSAYEVLAGGDEDSVWDQIPGHSAGDESRHASPLRMVY
jgi:hypothetical protein